MKKIVIKSPKAQWSYLSPTRLILAMKQVRKIYYRMFDAVEK
ncbi:MAG: hypothetical protein AB8G05_24915 [Oligoflexales bacterium]